MKKISISDVSLKKLCVEDYALMFREKLAIAELLDNCGADAVELPLLIDSKEDEIVFRTISSSLKNAIVKIPVGDTKESIIRTAECVKNANKVCLQVVMPVSTVQMEYFYHLKSQAMLEKIATLVKEAKATGYDVEFVALDAFRAEEGFVEECAKVAFDAGASSITVCDDAGEALPEDYVVLVKNIKKSCDILVNVQPSNDLSMSAICAVEAIKAGADGVVTSIVGSNVKNSVISDILRVKKFNLNAECSLDFTNVKNIEKSILEILENKIEVEQTKTVNSTSVSLDSSIKDIAEVVNQLGYELSDSDIGKVYEEFKRLASQKEEFNTKELEAIVASNAMQVPSTYHLVNYIVNSSNIVPATANVTLEKNGEKFTGVSTGDGPIDAAFHAIEQIIGHHYELDDFQVQAVTKGRSAVGSSLIRLRADGKLFPGNGVSTDIVGACIRAYINALNKIVYEEE